MLSCDGEDDGRERRLTKGPLPWKSCWTIWSVEWFGMDDSHVLPALKSRALRDGVTRQRAIKLGKHDEREDALSTS